MGNELSSGNVVKESYCKIKDENVMLWSAKNDRMKRVFSLIELLIVIAILSILASLLQPTLKSAMENARQIVCQNNLKQVYTAAIMYEDDSGYLPVGGATVLNNTPWTPNGWSQTHTYVRDIIPYLQAENLTSNERPEELKCPSNTTTPFNATESTTYIYTGNFEYQYNFIMFRGLGRQTTNTTGQVGGSKVALKSRTSYNYVDPSRTTIFADLNQFANTATKKIKVNHSSQQGNNVFKNATEIFLFSAGGNRNTLDGAVNWIDASQLGYDRASNKDSLPNQSNSRKYQAGPHYFYW